MLNINSATAVALLATLSSTVTGLATFSPAPVTNVVLKTKAINGGDPKFSNLYLANYNTGAGSNAVAGVNPSNLNNLPNFALTPQGRYQWTQNQGQVYQLLLADNLYKGDTAPQAYDSVQLNTTPGTTGFTVAPRGEVGVAQQNFESFLMCEVTQIYESSPPGSYYQLVWRAQGAPAPAVGGKCSDVQLFAEAA